MSNSEKDDSAHVNDINVFSDVEGDNGKGNNKS